MINWLRRWLAPDEVYVVVNNAIVSKDREPLIAHTTEQGAAEELFAGEAATGRVYEVRLVVD